MNWDQIKGKWMQFKGKAKEQWGDLTDDDLDRAAGERDQLVGRIQERYGLAKEEAQGQVDEWSRRSHGSAAEPRRRLGACYSSAPEVPPVTAAWRKKNGRRRDPSAVCLSGESHAAWGYPGTWAIQGRPLCPERGVVARQAAIRSV